MWDVTEAERYPIGARLKHSWWLRNGDVGESMILISL